MTLTREDLLNQRVDDLEEWVGALSDLLSAARKDLAEARQQLDRTRLSLDDHRHTCSVCGANDSWLETDQDGYPGTRHPGADPEDHSRRGGRLLRALGL